MLERSWALSSSSSSSSFIHHQIKKTCEKQEKKIQKKDDRTPTKSNALLLSPPCTQTQDMRMLLIALWIMFDGKWQNMVYTTYLCTRWCHCSSRYFDPVSTLGLGIFIPLQGRVIFRFFTSQPISTGLSHSSDDTTTKWKDIVNEIFGISNKLKCYYVWICVLSK